MHMALTEGRIVIMIKCSRCSSGRILEVSAKCSDCFSCYVGSIEFDGYVPGDLGIGDGDYIGFSYCLDCGQMVGKFPLAESFIEKVPTQKELEEYYDEEFDGEKYIKYEMVRNRSGYFSLDNFVKRLIRNNEGQYFPSKEKFIQMFLNNEEFVV